MPQVGESTQEMGVTQPGSRDSGTSSPVASQTGYSRRLENAFALRYSTNVEARSRPSMPRLRIVAGSATASWSGCSNSSGVPKKMRPQRSVANTE